MVRLPESLGWATLPGMTRSQVVVALIVLIILGLVIAGIMIRSDLRCSGFSGPGVSADELPPPPPSGAARVATWNIRNFPLDERPQERGLPFFRRTNICDLHDALVGIDADILGFCEIRDTRRFPPVLRRAGGARSYRIVFTQHGGAGGQYVAVAWDDDRFELVEDPEDVRNVAVRESLRPALAVYLRSRAADGLDLTVIQVHLRSMPQGYSTRLDQYRALAQFVEARVARIGDRDVLVMGDFNTTGREGGTTAEELVIADRILAAAGLRRLENVTGCTEYWEGGGFPDGRLVPSLLDHIWVGGLEDQIPEGFGVRSWLHCERLRCGEMFSSWDRADATFWDVSDHCPITLDIR